QARDSVGIEEVFTPLSIDTGPTRFVVDQFGFLLPLAGVAVAVIFWRRRAEVEQAAPAGAGKEAAPGMGPVPPERQPKGWGKRFGGRSSTGSPARDSREL